MNLAGTIKLFIVVSALGGLTRMVGVWSTSWATHQRAALPDETQYCDMARGLTDDAGLRDELGLRATRMPLYPAFLSLFVDRPHGRQWALLVQSIGGALACGFTALLALQVTPAQPRYVTALVAGLLVAFDPFLAYMSGLLLTETLFTTGLCASMAIGWPTSERGRSCGLARWLVSGVLLSLCVYLRPVCVGFFVLWSAFVLIRRRAERGVILGTCCTWLVLVVALCPWAARNHSVLGDWVWLTTNMGISLYDAVHPGADGSSNQAEIKNHDAPELERDRYFKLKSGECMRLEPARMMRLAAIKFLRTWNLSPNAEGFQQPAVKWLSGAWTVVVLGSALAGSVLRRKEIPVLVGLLLPAIFFTGVHMLFVGSVRYRLPAMPMIEVLAATGCVLVLTRLKTGWRRGSPAKVR